uniref:Putative DNA binding, helix-turn-helix domain containing protein n=1 Tax=viral metagenome TaxID=1070528 RepID=A0A6H2A4S7_9ZZZZ
MDHKIKIQDDSGDKKYFTQIPNYIANHSTAIDQALYFQMKRYAGEYGRCFATQETLMAKMGIGRITYNKSLNYLLKKGWIKFIGTTKGKTRPIKTYSIVDIWKLNIMEYEKIPSETDISFEKIPSETNRDTVSNSSKIPSETNSIRRTIKEEHINNNKLAKFENFADTENFSHKQIIEIFDVFKKINPMINYGHKTQRQAVVDFIGKFGFEKTKQFAVAAIAIQGRDFAPTITNPYLLKIKLGELKIYYQKQNSNSRTLKL